MVSFCTTVLLSNVVVSVGIFGCVCDKYSDVAFETLSPMEDCNVVRMVSARGLLSRVVVSASVLLENPAIDPAWKIFRSSKDTHTVSYLGNITSIVTMVVSVGKSRALYVGLSKRPQ